MHGDIQRHSIAPHGMMLRCSLCRTTRYLSLKRRFPPTRCGCGWVGGVGAERTPLFPFFPAAAKSILNVSLPTIRQIYFFFWIYSRGRGHHLLRRLSISHILPPTRYIFENDLMANAERLGAISLERMQAMMGRHQLIGDVRGIGLLLGIELVKDRGTKARV